MRMPKAKLMIAVPTLALVILLDVLSKQWALQALGGGESLHLFGGAVPLTLAFNTGAAFSMNVGEASRWVFLALSLAALVVLGFLYRGTRPGDRPRLLALSLVASGAIGNLVDRIRWDQGVVDFIGPINLGFMYWPIFNVADTAITTGAALLVFSLWREDRATRAPAPATGSTPAAEPATDSENP
jgi:signal peptidase II